MFEPVFTYDIVAEFQGATARGTEPPSIGGGVNFLREHVMVFAVEGLI
jgi:hypothetical protein